MPLLVGCVGCVDVAFGSCVASHEQAWVSTLRWLQVVGLLVAVGEQLVVCGMVDVWWWGFHCGGGSKVRSRGPVYPGGSTTGSPSFIASTSLGVR